MSDDDGTLTSCSACRDSDRVRGLLLFVVSLFPRRLDDIHPLTILCVFTDRTGRAKRCYTRSYNPRVRYLFLQYPNQGIVVGGWETLMGYTQM